MGCNHFLEISHEIHFNVSYTSCHVLCNEHYLTNACTSICILVFLWCVQLFHLVTCRRWIQPLQLVGLYTTCRRCILITHNYNVKNLAYGQDECQQDSYFWIVMIVIRYMVKVKFVMQWWMFAQFSHFFAYTTLNDVG